MSLDSPEKIIGLVVVMVILRLIATLWKTMPRRASVTEFADSALVAVVLVFALVRPLLVQSFWIPSGSMRPTLLEHDMILANKFIYRLGPPRRGDVVVFQAPPGVDIPALPGQGSAGQSLFHMGQDLVKRLVALPGETVEVRAGEGVFINGKPLPERYISWDRLPSYDMGPIRVPAGCYFVLGDNRNNSLDSHIWGTLPAQQLRGKAMLLFWPPGRFGLIH